MHTTNWNFSWNCKSCPDVYVLLALTLAKGWLLNKSHNTAGKPTKKAMQELIHTMHRERERLPPC